MRSRKSPPLFLTNSLLLYIHCRIFRTLDLTLELNNITNQLQSQNIEQHPEQLMFTQPRDPKSKTKPAYRKNCSYCHRTNHSISPCFKKHRVDDEKKKPIRDQNLHKNLLYNTSVQTLMIEQKDLKTGQMNITTDNAVEEHHKTTTITKILAHRTDIVLHHEIEFIMTETLLLFI